MSRYTNPSHPNQIISASSESWGWIRTSDAASAIPRVAKNRLSSPTRIAFSGTYTIATTRASRAGRIRYEPTWFRVLVDQVVEQGVDIAAAGRVGDEVGRKLDLGDRLDQGLDAEQQRPDEHETDHRRVDALAARLSGAEQVVERYWISASASAEDAGKDHLAADRRYVLAFGTWFVKSFFLQDQDLIAEDAVNSINALVAEIDKKLTDQINEILHHADFQQMEGSWRGLKHLVFNTEVSETLKIKMFNVSKKDLGKTLKRYPGTSWDQSPVFKKMYEEEYGTIGGDPFGCLVGDYYFDHSPQDVELLRGISQIAAAAHAPFIAAAAPTLMGFDSWQELSNPRDLTKIFTHGRIRSVALAARLGRRPLCRAHYAALPVAAALRSEDRARRGVRVRGRHGWRRIPPSTPGRTRHMRWRRTSTRHSRCTAGARAFAAWSLAVRLTGCRATRSRRTTAAWT